MSAKLTRLEVALPPEPDNRWNFNESKIRFAITLGVVLKKMDCRDVRRARNSSFMLR